MKTLLVGINAKYIHSNLAIHSISSYAKAKAISIKVEEYTINQSVDDILGSIFKHKPEVLGFSCYIWNIEIICKLVVEIKKVLPKLIIILGGPEVSYEQREWLNQLPMVDVVVYGEGEVTMTELIKSINQQRQLDLIPLESIQGIAYRAEKIVQITPPRKPIDMDLLPFIYENDLEAYGNRILYYETSRGCPFNCQYCLSSIEKGTRFRSIKKVFEALDFFMEKKIHQVKFVDRTFNANPKRTDELWRYIIQKDNGVTNFHFEIAADLLTKSNLSILKKARPGLIQLEIGVQSTHVETLTVVDRVTDFDKLSQQVRAIQSFRNTHIHLDLIAGLPNEDYMTFGNSFNEVYELRPDQLQLGFLKVLSGSGMKAMASLYELQYRDYAPYEILSTHVMGFGEIQQLKMLEYVLELYYNSGHYKHALAYLIEFHETAFDFYSALGEFFRRKKGHMIKHSMVSLYDLLYDFSRTILRKEDVLFAELLTYDLLLQERLKKQPSWYLEDLEDKELFKQMYIQEALHHEWLPKLAMYNGKQLSRLCQIKLFSGAILQYIQAEVSEIHNNEKYEKIICLFDYTDRNPLNHEPLIKVFDYVAMCDLLNIGD